MNSANDTFSASASYVQDLLKGPLGTAQRKIETDYKSRPLWERFQILEVAVDLAAGEPDDRKVKEEFVAIILPMLHALTLHKPGANAVREVLWHSLYHQPPPEKGPWRYQPGFDVFRTAVGLIERLERGEV